MLAEFPRFVSETVKFTKGAEFFRNLEDKFEQAGEAFTPEDRGFVNTFVEQISPYLLGYFQLGRAIPLGLKSLKAKDVSTFVMNNVAVDSVIGFVMDDPKHDNLVTILRDKFPQAFGWLPEALANNENEAEAMSRFKNSVVSAGIGLPTAGAMEGIMRTFYRLIKSSKSLQKEAVAIPDEELPPPLSLPKWKDPTEGIELKAENWTPPYKRERGIDPEPDIEGTLPLKPDEPVIDIPLPPLPTTKNLLGYKYTPQVPDYNRDLFRHRILQENKPWVTEVEVKPIKLEESPKQDVSIKTKKPPSAKGEKTTSGIEDARKKEKIQQKINKYQLANMNRKAQVARYIESLEVDTPEAKAFVKEFQNDVVKKLSVDDRIKIHLAQRSVDNTQFSEADQILDELQKVTKIKKNDINDLVALNSEQVLNNLFKKGYIIKKIGANSKEGNLYEVKGYALPEAPKITKQVLPKTERPGKDDLPIPRKEMDQINRRYLVQSKKDLAGVPDSPIYKRVDKMLKSGSYKGRQFEYVRAKIDKPDAKVVPLNKSNPFKRSESSDLDSELDWAALEAFDLPDPLSFVKGKFVESSLPRNDKILLDLMKRGGPIGNIARKVWFRRRSGDISDGTVLSSSPAPRFLFKLLGESLERGDIPVIPAPEFYKDDEDDEKYKVRISFILNPRYLAKLVKANRNLDNFIASKGGVATFANSDDLAKQVSDWNRTVAIKKTLESVKKPIAVEPIRPQAQANYENQFVKNYIGRRMDDMQNRGLFIEIPKKALVDTFIRVAKKHNVGIKDFNFNTFSDVTANISRMDGDQSLLTDPNRAFEMYMTTTRKSFAEQAPPQVLRPPSEGLAGQERVLRTGQDVLLEGEEIGIIAKEIGEKITVGIKGLESEVNKLSSMYSGTRRLSRLGIKFPKDLTGNKTTILPELEESLIAYHRQITDLFSEHALVTSGSAERMKQLAGATLKGMDPGRHGLNTPELFKMVKTYNRSAEKATASIRALMGKTDGPAVDINTATRKIRAVSRPIRAIPARVIDVLTENLVSGMGTWTTVNVAAFTKVLDRQITGFMVDLIRMGKKAVGHVTGDEFLKHSPANTAIKRWQSYLHHFSGASKDWEQVITGKKDANLMSYNMGSSGTHLFDAFKGHGNAHKLLEKYRKSNFYQAGKENGFKNGYFFAQVPDYALRGINSTWGIGKLQATDSFYKRLSLQAEIMNFAEKGELKRLSQLYAQTGKRPTFQTIRDSILARQQEALDNYRLRIADPAVGNALDELDRGLFRSSQAKIIGSEAINLGDSVRSFRKALKIFGTAGRMAGVFLEVGVNGADHFTQRLPGVNWLNPTIRKEWEEFGPDEVIAKSLTGAVLSMLGTFGYLKFRDQITVTDGMKDKMAFYDLYGYHPPHDIVLQMGVVSDGVGRQYVVDPLTPIGQQLNYAMVMSHYIDKFGQDKDVSKLLASSMLYTARNVGPTQLFTQFAEFFGFFEDLGKGDNPQNIASFPGSAIQKLTEVGFVKELKDFQRGFKTRIDKRKGTVYDDLSGRITDSPHDLSKGRFYGLDFPRIAENQLPIIVPDEGEVPDVSWNGHEITLRDRKQNGPINNLEDYLSMLFKRKTFKDAPYHSVLWEINNQEGGPEKLNLSPTNSFSMNDVILSQSIQGFQKGEASKGFAALKTNAKKRGIEWKFNDQDHRQVKRLSAGLPVKVSVRMGGKTKTIKIDFEKEVKKMFGINANQVASDYMKDPERINYAVFRGFQENLKNVYQYGPSKEKAVIDIIGDKQFSALQKEVEKENKSMVPHSWQQLRRNIQKVMETKFSNINKKNLSLDTAESSFMFNRLLLHFDTGRFSDSANYTHNERRENTKQEMRMTLNKVTRAYNQLAKNMFIEKVYSQSDDFIEKVFEPEQNILLDRYQTGPYHRAIKN